VTQGEQTVAVDLEAVAEGLRALGLVYGASRPPAAAMTGATSAAQAIRAYLEQERPHLLRCYDIETLVTLVMDASATRPDAFPAVERFGPAR
jgi:hypothetical protein